MTVARMNVGIIGAGRIGGTLARGLAAAGRDNYYPQPRAGGRNSPAWQG